MSLLATSSSPLVLDKNSFLQHEDDQQEEDKKHSSPNRANLPQLVERAKRRIVFAPRGRSSSPPSLSGSSPQQQNSLLSSPSNNNNFSSSSFYSAANSPNAQSRNTMRKLLNSANKKQSEEAQILELQRQQQARREQLLKQQKRLEDQQEGEYYEDDENENEEHQNTNRADQETQNPNNKKNLTSLPAATLQERILSAKVKELTEALEKTGAEKDGLSRSLRTAIHQNEETKAKLDSVSELLAATVAENKEYEKFFLQMQQYNRYQALDSSSPSTNHNNSSSRSTRSSGGATFMTSASSPAHEQQHLIHDSSSSSLISLIMTMKPKTQEKGTQAPDVPDAAAFDAEIERQSLYSSKDVRAALMSLLDRHDDVKELLLRNSWLRRNEDFCAKFPSFVKPIRPVAVELVDGKRPPTAETLLNANDTPRSVLHSELSEFTRRAHPGTRHRTLSQKQKFREEERDKRTNVNYPGANEVISWQDNNSNAPQQLPSPPSHTATTRPSTSSQQNAASSPRRRNLIHFSARPNTAGTSTMNSNSMLNGSMMSTNSTASPNTRPASRK